MTGIMIAGGIGIIIGWIFLFALCKVASEADERCERIFEDELRKAMDRGE